ncbi:MAG: sigma-70 family RNA polymerase sigma factor [Pseudomonadota bacterium]
MLEAAELYRTHRGWLIAWLRQRLNCPEIASDLAQDTFVKLLGKQTEAEIRQPRAYLRTIAHGLLVDFVRHREIERTYFEILRDLDAPTIPSEEERIILIETLVRIEVTLSGLPRRAREVLILSRLEGLAYREIAACLGVSLSTVEKDMALALRHCYRIRYES